MCNVCAERCAGAAGAVAGVASHRCSAVSVWARRRTAAEEGDGNDAIGFNGLLTKAYDELLDAPVCFCAGVKRSFDTKDSAARCDVAL